MAKEVRGRVVDDGEVLVENPAPMGDRCEYACDVYFVGSSESVQVVIAVEEVGAQRHLFEEYLDGVLGFLGKLSQAWLESSESMAGWIAAEGLVRIEETIEYVGRRELSQAEVDVVGVLPAEPVGVEVVPCFRDVRLDQEVNDLREDAESLVDHPDEGVVIERIELAGEVDEATLVVGAPEFAELELAASIARGGMR